MTITRIPPQAIQAENVQYLTSQTWATGVNTYDYRQGPVFYHATTPTINWTADFINIPTLYLANQGQAYNNFSGLIVEVKICATLGATSYYPNAVRIEGAAQTLLLQGTTGTVSKFNIWTYQLVRVGSSWVKVCLKNHEAY